MSKFDKKKKGAYRKKIKGEKPRAKVGEIFPVKEIRYNNSEKGRGHPTVICKIEGGCFIGFGITHKPSTRGKKNILMHRNPNPADDTPAFIRPVAVRIERWKFSKPIEGWVLHELDEEIIEGLLK